MTLDELEQLIAKVELRNYPYPIRLQTRRVPVARRGPVADGVFGFALEVDIVSSVKERGTGHPIETTVSQAYEEGIVAQWDEHAAMNRVVYVALRDVVVHELEEALHFGGERWRDPHDRDDVPLPLPPNLANLRPFCDAFLDTVKKNAP